MADTPTSSTDRSALNLPAASLPESFSRRATPETIRQALRPLMSVFGVSEAASTPIWWAAYYDALSELSEGALVEAVRLYLRLPDVAFFPKPGQLLAIAAERNGARARAAARAQAIADQIAARDSGPLPEERAAVGAMLEGFMADMKRKGAALSPQEVVNERVSKRQPPFGRVNEHGITADMQRWLDRDRAKEQSHG